MHRLLIALALCLPVAAARAQQARRPRRRRRSRPGAPGSRTMPRGWWRTALASWSSCPAPIRRPHSGPAQAAALLADFLASAQEVETVVRAAREVEPGRGYVELQRRYRVAGTQDVRTQSLLLGYRLTRTGWSLVELRVVG